MQARLLKKIAARAPWFAVALDGVAALVIIWASRHEDEIYSWPDALIWFLFAMAALCLFAGMLADEAIDTLRNPG